MKTIIIGGVASGASAAARLRRLDEQAEIILLERGDYISFANCGLPYYIGGDITQKSDLTLQTPKSFHSRFCVDVRTGQEAVAIDPAAKTVTVHRRDGSEYTESYDKLILSPGAQPLRPAIPGIEDSRIFTLRSIPDTYAIDTFIKEHTPKRAAVIGGGYIGVEMAENLTRRGLQVSLVEAASHIMAPLDEEMAAAVQQTLRQHGVALHLGNGVKAFHPAENGLQIELENGSIQADFVLLSIGVAPESSLAKAAGLTTGQRGAVVVNRNLQTSNPDIYAAGDVVQAEQFGTGQPVYIPLAGPANKQGRIAADNIHGIHSEYKGTQGTSVLKLFHSTVAATGRNERELAAAGVEYDKVYLQPQSHAGYYPGGESMLMKVIFALPTGRLLGAQIVGGDGVDKRIDVLATALRAGMAVDDLAELELAYAPPYSSAKDPVNMAGFAAGNVLHGLVRQYHWHDVDSLPRDGSVTLLDVRTPKEYTAGAIEGTRHIPVDELRQRLPELDKTRPVYVNCQSGLRSYVACRILSQNGFDCHNLAGGYALYSLVKSDRVAR